MRKVTFYSLLRLSWFNRYREYDIDMGLLLRWSSIGSFTTHSVLQYIYDCFDHGQPSRDPDPLPSGSPIRIWYLVFGLPKLAIWWSTGNV